MEENDGVTTGLRSRDETYAVIEGDQLFLSCDNGTNSQYNSSRKTNTEYPDDTDIDSANNNSSHNNSTSSRSSSSGGGVGGGNGKNSGTCLNNINCPEESCPQACEKDAWQELELLLLPYAVNWTHPITRERYCGVFRGRDPSTGNEVAVGVKEDKLGEEENEEKRMEDAKEVEEGVKEVPVWLQGHCPDSVRLLKAFAVNERGVRLTVTVVHWARAREAGDIPEVAATGIDAQQEECHTTVTAGMGTFRRVSDEGEKEGGEVVQQMDSHDSAPVGETAKQHQNDEEGREEDEDDEEEEEGNGKQRPLRAYRGSPWILNPYVINKNDIIGRGKFGTVYRGVNEKEGSVVAAKVLRGTSEKKERLLTEARELNRLQALGHPNIIRLFGVYRSYAGNMMSLVHILEFCQGGDLKEFLSRHDPLTEQQARRIMRQLVDCLCVLKANHTMHRDLKPANILLSSSNIDEAIVKVADWGMAKRSNAHVPSDSRRAGNTNNTMFESAVGTMAYMSPERLVRDFYDFQAEVWAAGVIMYELLFARHPYLHSTSSVRTPEELLNAITRAEELETIEKVRHSDCGVHGGKSAAPQSKTGNLPLSQNCYTLLRRMLDSNAKTRLTIEEVQLHPWFTMEETTNTTTEVELAEAPVNLKIMTKEEASTGAVTTSLTPSLPKPTTVASEVTTVRGGLTSEMAGNPAGSIQLQNPDDDAENGIGLNLSKNLGISQRQQAIYQAVRDHMYVLRHYVIEAEVEPGRGLVLLSYAWELLRAAVHAAITTEYSLGVVGSGGSSDSTTVTEPLLNGSPTARYALCLIPDDIRQMETYIQDTAERLKRNLPDLSRKGFLGAAHMAFSTTSLSGADDPAASFSCPSPSLSRTTYPCAQSLLFKRAISLIYTATSEEIMFGCNEEHDGYMEEDEIVYLQGGRSRRQRTYEQAMSILRLLLQQVVVRRGAVDAPSSLTPIVPNTAGGGLTDTQDHGTLQVLTVPLLPPIAAADQRTVQALLYKVEKHYRRLLNVR